MTAEVRPWFKFYPRDWRADEELRVCSLAARGLWMEMLALMHSAKPYGHLLINEQPPTDAQLASLAGAPLELVATLLAELDSTGVFSRTRAGVIYSRRMVRDEKRRLAGHKSAKNGPISGNSHHVQDYDRKRKTDLPPGGAMGSPTGYPPPQRPETQRAELKIVGSSSSDSPRALELDLIERLLREAAGLENDPSPGLFDLSPMIGLIDAGFDLEKHLCPTVKAVMRKQKAGFKPRSWAYFVPAIHEAAAQRSQAASVAAPKREDDETRWRRMYDAYRRGTWADSWGPTPDMGGCQIPQRLIEKWDREAA